MQIFSAPGLVFPGVAAAAAPPPALVSALDLGDAKQEFETFGQLVELQAPRDSLSNAMYANFITKTRAGGFTPGESLYARIITKYQEINTSGDPRALFLFNLYLYITLHHLCAWYARNIVAEAGTTGPLLRTDIRKYIKERLSARSYGDGITIAPEFFNTDEFKNAFGIDETLLKMVSDDRLGHLTGTNLLGRYDYLSDSAGKLGLLDRRRARAVKREFIQSFRSEINNLIVSDVKRCLALLNVPPSPIGTALANGYGDFRQYGVGNGTGTRAMFGIDNFGLIFFNYELTDLSDPNHPCEAVIPDVLLLDVRDPPNTAVCFLYYGLDNNYDTPQDKPKAPIIELKRYNSERTTVEGQNVLSVYKPTDHLPDRAQELLARQIDVTALKREDFSPLSDVLVATLHSSSDQNPEELIYIVFKHRIFPPVLRSPHLTLNTKWELLDNKFRKTPAEEQAEVFFGQNAQLTSLVAALAADSGFEIFSQIEGLGIGTPLDKPRDGTGGLALERAPDQTDKPPPAKPSYDHLRYAHGRLEWYPDPTGPGGWLVFYVTGFVSPLRCTWEEKFQNPALQKLKDDIKPYVTKDSQGRASYNCVLSAFRAFALFESMIKIILLEALGDSEFSRISTTLNAHLNTEAKVKVLLPTDRYMSVSGGVPKEFKRSEINQFN